MLNRIETVKKNFYNNAFNFLTIGLFVFLIFNIVLPIFNILFFLDKKNFLQIWSSNVFKDSLKRTFLLSIAVSFLSVFVGYSFAYIVVKSSLPLKKFFAFVPVLKLISPPVVGGISFILLFGKNGFITHNILKLNTSLYGFWGLLIVQTLTYFPIPYFICSQSLKNISSSYKEASFSLGASSFKTFWKIEFPLTLPSVISSLVFTIISVLSDFSSPLLIGGRYKTIALEIYSHLSGWLDYSSSTSWMLSIAIPSVLLFLIQNYYLKVNIKKFAIVGNKVNSRSSENTMSLLGNMDVSNSDKKASKSSWLVFVICFIVSLVVLSQQISLIFGAFQKIWGVDSTFSLIHLKTIPLHIRDIFNSVVFSFIASAIGAIVCVFVAYYTFRHNNIFSKVLDVIVQMPIVLPSLFYAFAYSCFNSNLNILPQWFLMILVLSMSYLPFSYREIVSGFMQISSFQDDASFSLGATQLKTLFKVHFPISKGSIFSAFTYSFIRGMGAISCVIFFVSFSTPITSLSILNLAEYGKWGDAAMLSLLMSLIVYTFVFIFKFLFFNKGNIIQGGKN